MWPISLLNFFALLTFLIWPATYKGQLEETPPFYSQHSPTLAGTTTGSFNVSDNGSATYTIPLIAPPGTGGVTPSLSISYNSGGGNGIMGLGWSLLGVSTIQRSSKTLAQDNEIDGVSFDASDTYSLDGERLVLVSGKYGADGSQYSTEQNVQMRITAKGNTPGFASPEGFEVRTKAGLIMEYGFSADSRIEAQGTNTVMFWCIKRIKDTKGNYMSFTYYENPATGEYYPTRIDYTGNENTGMKPYNSLVFTYIDRPDNTPRYINGSRLVSNKILRSIDCLYENQLVRRYSFEYQKGTYSNISILKSIQECGNQPGECLPATTFTYEEEQILDYKETSNRLFPESEVKDKETRLIQGDWNGDGMVDFFRVNSNSGSNSFYENKKDFIFEKNQNNLIDPSIVTKGYFQALDIDADGYTDLLWIDPVSGSNRVFLNKKTNPFSFEEHRDVVSPNHLKAENNKGVAVYPADWNGDGRIDFMTYVAATGRNRFFLNRSVQGQKPTFEIWRSVDMIPGGLISTNANQSLILGDWDNDGLTDFLWADKKAKSAQASNRWIRNTGNGYVIAFKDKPKSNSNIDFRGGTGLNLGDWNGDGLSDLMWYDDSNGETKWWINKGDLNFLNASANLPPNYVKGTGANYLPFDINGDGASDMVFIQKSTGKNHWFINDGKLDFSRPLDLIAPTRPGYLNPIPDSRLKGTSDIFVGTFSGKGGLDLFYVKDNQSVDNNKGFESKPSPKFLLKKIVNGQGVITSINYKPLTDPTVYTKGLNARYPAFDFISGMLVVSDYSVDNGSEGKITVSNHYHGAQLHMQGRGFRGFAEIVQRDEISGITTTRYFDRDHKYVATPMVRTTTQMADGQIINERAHVNDLIPYYKDKAFASHVKETNSQEFELSRDQVSNIKTNMTYDDYGNLLKSVVYYGDGHVDSTLNYYKGDNIPKWIIGRLTRSEVYKKAPGKEWVKRTAAFEYNSIDGLLIKETSQPHLPREQQIVKSYKHDAFGNVVESRIEFFNGESFETRISKSTYDARGRFSVSFTNPLGHIRRTEYDPLLGHPIKEIDENGLVTTIEYDALGRVVKTNFPDGNWETMTYTDCREDSGGPLNAVFCVTTQSAVKPEVKTYFDVLGREILSESVGFDGTPILKSAEYNVRGQIARTSEPYYPNEDPVWTSLSYDTLGREIKMVAPGNRISQTVYDGLTTTYINPLGQRTTVIKDVPGRVVEVIDDAGKKLNFAYDSFGNMLSAKDPKGNQQLFTYDLYGNLTSLSDPDMGVYFYEYNTMGELKKTTNPKGQVTTFKYDLLGRLIQRSEEEGITRWVYDTAENGVGKLATVEHPDYRQEFVYDELSRVKRNTEIIKGKTFRTDTYYDEVGRLMSLHYPGGFSIRYSYNDDNYLSEVSDNTTGRSLWKINAMNARMQLERSAYGNGVSTKYTYDDETFWLTNIQSTRQGADIQDLSYSYNAIGNLTERINSLQKTSENFSYDRLNRLVKSQAFGTGSLEMTYDELGNILSKSDVGEYRYGESGAGPHQLTSIVPYGEDVCLPIRSTQLAFTSFNMLETMENDSASLSISYKPNRMRAYQEISLHKELREKKYYLSSLYERVETDSTSKDIYYIHGLNGVIGVLNRYNTGEEEMDYWHKDHLGSLQTVTNQRGEISEVLSFDPWGKRKHEKVASKTPPFKYDRGFTGHEHLDLFGLINMNGRVYDPTLGRFISPDPFIQSPHNLQNYNRYAYVLNAPLSYTDPSGFFWKEIERGIRSVGKAIGNVGRELVSGLENAWREVDNWGSTAFGQENWNTIKVTAAVITVAVITGGAGTFVGTILSGAATGFTGAAAGVLAAGGSYEQALKAGAKGAVIGAATAAATYGVGDLGDALMGGGKGAYNGAAWTGKKFAVYGLKTISHGLVQGGASVLRGGKFEHGFLSGSFTEIADPLMPRNVLAGTVASAAVGGTASVIGGDKFSNGAISGTMVFMYNNVEHWVNTARYVIRGSFNAATGAALVGLAIEAATIPGGWSIAVPTAIRAAEFFTAALEDYGKSINNLKGGLDDDFGNMLK